MAERSFKEYIVNRFEDEEYNIIKKFILVDRFNSEFITKGIEYPSSTAGDSIRGLFVSVNDLPEMKVQFVITLEVRVSIYVSNGHWDEFDECYLWI